MPRFACLTAVAALIAGSAALAQPEMRLPALEYGETVLNLRESLGGAAAYVAARQNVFEPVGDLREDDVFFQIARSVGRLDLLIEEGGEQFVSTCTATVLAGGSQLLTNHHCVPGFSGTVLEASVVLDYYDADSEVIRLGVDVTPAESDPALDYAILNLLDPAPADLAPVIFNPVDVQPRERLVMFHHPLGMPKMMTQFQCAAARSMSPETELRHACDTQPGSSGAPIFNLERQIVGLHHSGGLNANDIDSFNSATMVRDIAVLASLAVPPQTDTPATSAAPAVDTTATQPILDLTGAETGGATGADSLNDLIQGEISGN